MAASVTLLATRLQATAAATATALGGGVTTADVQELAKFLKVLAGRPGSLIPPLGLSGSNLEPR